MKSGQTENNLPLFSCGVTNTQGSNEIFACSHCRDLCHHMMFTLGLLLQYLSPRVRPTHDISKKMSQTSLESNMSLKIKDISKSWP